MRVEEEGGERGLTGAKFDWRGSTIEIEFTSTPFVIWETSAVEILLGTVDRARLHRSGCSFDVTAEQQLSSSPAVSAHRHQVAMYAEQKIGGSCHRPIWWPEAFVHSQYDVSG